MGRLRIAICIVFVVSSITCAVYMVKSRLVEDHTPPEISCEEDSISVSVEDAEEELLKGVTAKDNRDGDLTDSVRVSSMSHFINGKRIVTYAVFDKANQVGTLERTLQYTDYTSPKIYLKKPLRISVTDISRMNLTENVEAKDCLDGDISSQVRAILPDNFYGDSVGTYPVTLQVNNSAGDVRTLEVELTVTEAGDRDEQSKQYPLLSDYIVYTTVGKKINTSKYIIGLERNGMEYTYEDDEEMLEGTKDDIVIKSDVDYDTPGVYAVTYSYRAEGSEKAVSKMFVVVEEK